MDEATPSLSQAQRQAMRRRIAVRVLAQEAAIREVKAKIQREGRIKVAQVPVREIVAMAEDYILALREIIVEARDKVERREAEDAAKRRARLNTSAQSARADLQALRLFKCHAQNGETK